MQKQLSRTKMLNTARALFWEKGYNAAGMRDIARAYGCKPANIYNFYRTKEDLLFAVLLEEMEQIISPIARFETDETPGPLDQLRTIIDTHVALTLSHRRSAKTLFDVALDNLSPAHRRQIIGLRDQYDRILRRVVQRGKTAGLFGDIDERLAGFMISSMITRTRIWYRHRKGLSVKELSAFIFQFTLRGLAHGEGSGPAAHNR